MAEITHKADLVWFTSYGVSYFEKSTLGGQLDAVIFSAFGSRPCKPCRGSGIVDEPWTQYTRTHRMSFGKDIEERLDVPIHHATGKVCEVCGGKGHRMVKLIRKPGHNMMKVNVQRERCQRGAPDDEVLIRYAFVSRRLNRMPRELAETMLLAYSDEGELLEANNVGRIWAVAPITQDGRELLEAIRATPSDSDNHFRAAASILEFKKEVAKAKPCERIQHEIALLNIEHSSRQLLALAELTWDSLENCA